MRSPPAIVSIPMATPACSFRRGADERRIFLLPPRERRRGAHRRHRDAARDDPHAGLHAGRHRGDGQGDVSGRSARARRRRRARQHLSSDAGARRRADRQARRPAQVHELAAPDPHRFRRLPGDEPRQAAQARRARRRLPVAYRRLAPRTDARARDGDPAPARLRHPDAARRMRAPALPVRGSRARDAAVAALGGALASAAFGAQPGRAIFGIVQGGDEPDAAQRERARARRAWISTATRSAAWRSASRRR